MSSPLPNGPSARTRELETLLARIRHAGNIELNHDMWERWGSAHASDEERATWATDVAQASRDRAAATAALETLVATTRADAPAELAAWVDAHDAYLVAFLADCEAKGEAGATGAFVAAGERAAWAEVRAGTRAIVDENLFYVTMNAERYGRLFGINPQTLAPVE